MMAMTMRAGLLLLLSVASATAADEAALIPPLIEWLKEKGGFFSDKLKITTIGDTPRYGVIAAEDIAENETMIVIPRNALLTDNGGDGRSYGGLWCPTVRNLIEQMKLGDESEFAPYINYLKSQSYGQLPSGWSKAGKALLLEVLGQDDQDEENDLRPNYATAWLDQEWKKDCEGGDDPDEQQAALLLLQRGWDDVMIPVYDMMSHRNGWWLNTASNSVHDKEEPVKVWALRPISAGEEIYTSYNFCADCGNRASGYGTPEIVRDYGFVENFPQRWYFGWRFSFLLDEEYNRNDEKTGRLYVEWLTKKKPKKAAKVWLRSILSRLQDVADFALESPDPTIPASELDLILSYHKAAMTAIEHAFKFLKYNYDTPTGDEDCQGDVCAVGVRYDDLGWRPDDLGYAIYTCDTRKSMSYKGFETLEETESHYQTIDFVMDPRNDNVCFDISSIIQMCGSYRPQYHEMVVHYTARFLPEIKRVIWVGGGDSMLLHEILKYPTLEFVVGLEIDQVVTRLSFKHTGTQPHFDNPKVQWWYGDAAKSLLMLPKSYFGSFDMVLVDLSETVTSALVTDKLDIMQALSLLLKPEGILVKNELYMEQMAEIFHYSLQIHYPYVPVICSQCLILGSHRIDFLYDTLHDHEYSAPNLYIRPLPDIDDRHEYVHDYRRNSTAIHLCKEEGAPEDPEPTKQKRSPGILMIVEAEDTTVDLEDVDSVVQAFVTALVGAGLTKVSTFTYSHPKRDLVGIVLEQGYIIARVFPEYKYVGIDLHMWSSFDLQEAAKAALVKALGSDADEKSSSSYRIVAGGMFGTPTWKDDTKKRGPIVTDSCKAPKDTTVRETVMETKIHTTVLEEAIQLIPDMSYTIAVVCGSDASACTSLDIVRKDETATKVLPLMPCEGISDDHAYEEGFLEKMIACEKELHKALMGEVGESDIKQKIRAIVIDPTAAHTYSRIVYKVLKGNKYRLLQPQNLFAIGIMFKHSDDWRRNFMERFRKDVITGDPNYRVEVLLNNTESSVEVDMTYSGDQFFVHKLVQAVENMEKTTGLVADMRDIKGGLYVEDPDWEWSHFFLPQDWDQTSPLEQFMSQVPLGYQTVFQLEPKKAKDKVSLSKDILKVALRKALGDLKSVYFPDRRDMKNAKYHVESGTMGDGVVILAFWQGGTCVLLWDGRKHIDLNLFTFVDSQALAKDFEAKFKAQFTTQFETKLCDVQPRGFGRVVNFASDIGPRSMPHWAKFK